MGRCASVPAMRPCELLANERYAVARFVDGEFGWVSGTFAAIGAATECAEDMSRWHDADYRVVRIDHGREQA